MSNITIQYTHTYMCMHMNIHTAAKCYIIKFYYV